MTALSPAFLAKTRETNCTVWVGSTNNKGYGIVQVDGALRLAQVLPPMTSGARKGKSSPDTHALPDPPGAG